MKAIFHAAMGEKRSTGKCDKGFTKTRDKTQQNCEPTQAYQYRLSRGPGNRIRSGKPRALTALAVTAIFLSLSLRAFAQGGGESENKAPLPDWFGQARSVSVAPSLGAVSESLAIEVSPGRRGIEPSLVLNYSSMVGIGDQGLGWRVATGRVERWPGDGTPTVGDPDSYLYSLSGAGGELRNTGGGVYRAELENVYREFRKLPDVDDDGVFDGWTTSNGEGAIHRFGGTPDSRIEDQVWMLDQVQDPSGNVITYEYERVNERLYPKVIRRLRTASGQVATRTTWSKPTPRR